MPADSAVEKLRKLEVFPDDVEHTAEAFRTSSTLDGILSAIRQHQWSCSREQFLYFHVEALLNADAAYRANLLDDACAALKDTGIVPEHIREYLTLGAEAGLVFNLRHEDTYDWPTRREFCAKADQFVFDKFRLWLGVTDLTNP